MAPPIIAAVMRWKKSTIANALLALLVSVYPASQLGSDFMPTLNEGTLLYMLALLPGMSITKARRANTATDPAPTEGFETVINLKPESEWRSGLTMDTLIAEPDREQLARYGLAVGDVLDVIGTALGGEMVTTTVQGRERCDWVCALLTGYMA